MWSKQVAICASVVAHRRTAVKSCHGVGKSHLASRLVAWWLATRPVGQTFVVTTAPTFHQVRGVLWRYIGQAHRKGALPGRVNQTEWWMGPELVAFGRKPADTDAESIQGIHADHVLVVLDEACGIPESLWITAGTLLTNASCRMLAIGNPDDPNSHFARVCRPDSGWHVIGISAHESPNFTGEIVPADLRPKLVDHVYLNEMAADVGEGSPVWTAKVLGEFPEDATDVVVPLSWVRRCQEREPSEPTGRTELGVDVGAGGDLTVIWARRGPKALRKWSAVTPESPQVVDLVLEAIAATGAEVVKVDTIGVGWGVVGRLRELRQQGAHGAQVNAVNVAEAPTRPSRYAKLRDQLWWEVGRELSQHGGWDLSAVDDRTVAQLCSPRWHLDTAGRIKVEPKEETRKRLGRSPDDADALLLAFEVSGQGSAFVDFWRSEVAKSPDVAAAPPLEPPVESVVAECPAAIDGAHHPWAGRCSECGAAV